MIEAGELSAEALIAELRQSGVTTVVLGGADTHAIMRGKRVPVEQLERLIEHRSEEHTSELQSPC